MPRLAAPVTVVDLPGKVTINEFFGGASTAPCGSAAGPDISLAHVKAKAGFAEDWQSPAFDEYVLVLSGSVTIEHAHGPSVNVPAGQAVYLAKGERVRWVFNEDAEYVPICLPAFSPANINREEEGDTPPRHDSHTKIYHLVQKHLWEACKAEGKTYFPPTYEADGFTHATADPSYLIGVANHFYKDVKAEWLCLGMTRASLAAAKITLKFEEPSPVGTTPALSALSPMAQEPSVTHMSEAVLVLISARPHAADKEQSGGERFPHIYGGIPPTDGVVFEERVVHRADDGTYTAIEGLC